MSTVVTSQVAKVVIFCASQDEPWRTLLQDALGEVAAGAGWTPGGLRVESLTDKEIHDLSIARTSVGDAVSEAAAIAFLISDDLLASPLVRNEEVAAVVATATAHIPSFRLLARPSTYDLGVLSYQSIGLLGTPDQALSTMTDSQGRDDIKRAANAIFERIVRGGGIESDANVSSRAADARRQQASKRAPNPPSSTRPDTTASTPWKDEDTGTEPLTRLSEFSTADSISFLMNQASEMASGATPPLAISTSFVFFAMAEALDTPGPWVPHFLRDVMAANKQPADYDQVRDRYFSNTGARGMKPRGKSALRGEPVEMTGTLHAALVRARTIATTTSRAPQIHARHLLAALVVEDQKTGPAGFLSRLGELGISAPAIREALFDWLRGHGDNDAAWEQVLLGTLPSVRRLSGYSTDRVGGEDLLNIEPEVRAIAALIAARTVSPPLSIGLFGEWGSGKTFFMRELRTAVEELACDARETKEMQARLPFYKHIVQIEFNAWHYVEGNLWASLVEHILDNLYPNEDRTGLRELQTKLIKKLADEHALAVASSNAVDTAQKAVHAARKDLETAQIKLDNKTRDLAKLNAARVRRDFVLTGAHQPVVDVLAKLGLGKSTPLGTSAAELESALREVHAVLDRGQKFLTPLTRAEDKGRRYTWLFLSLLGAPVVALIVRGVMQWLKLPVSDIYAYMAGLASFIASAVPWLKKQAEWMSERLDEAEKAQKAFDAEMARETAEHVRLVTQAEQKVRELTAALDTASQKHSEARDRQAAAAAELKAATTGRLLANFVNDRAASTDYRKHLGVLALVRDDFEKLSALIEDVNWTLSPEDPKEKPRTDGLVRFKTLEEENEESTGRINRIVLYIDDLDRCPPNKVVEVLQAVHLLLAFPLFVVVVGVDARWITRSLQTRYRELLMLGTRNGKDLAEIEEPDGILGTATANDYLEKIFQIPFWLKTMDATASEQMVRGLLKGSLAKPPDRPAGQTSADGNGGGSAQPSGSTGSASPSSPVQQQGAGTSDSPSGQQAASPTPASAGRTSGAAASGAERNRLALESLEITQAELDFMAKLAPVLGRSPRALKRFVNVYRLIKVGLLSHEQRTFLRQRVPLADFQKVLFLLAVDTGAPQVARKFFATVESGANTPPENAAPPRDIAWLVAAMSSEPNKGDRHKARRMDGSDEWHRLRQWLFEHQEVVPDNMELSSLAAWTGRVARYSFEVGRS